MISRLELGEFTHVKLIWQDVSKLPHMLREIVGPQSNSDGVGHNIDRKTCHDRGTYGPVSQWWEDERITQIFSRSPNCITKRQSSLPLLFCGGWRGGLHHDSVERHKTRVQSPP